MQPGYIALIFWGLSACAIDGVVHGLKTGVVIDPYTYRRDQEPTLFSLAILGKLSVVAIAIAETLHAFGLIGDPVLALHSILPFSSVHH